MPFPTSLQMALHANSLSDPEKQSANIRRRGNTERIKNFELEIMITGHTSLYLLVEFGMPLPSHHLGGGT